VNKPYLTQRSIIVLLILLVPPLVLAEESSDESVQSVAVQEVERAALATIENCNSDIARFCDDVTPGDSRVLACLHGYVDQVSAACQESLSPWQRPEWERGFQTTQIYPTLEQRELGEPNVDDGGERVIWKHKLPFLAQQVVDLGFELPNPYGVAIIPARIRQDLILQDLAIGINGPPDREIDFIDFGTPSVENTVLQLKLDAWIFPFLNVFTTVGVFDGDATIPLKFEGSDLFPQLCAITPNAPVCVRTYSEVAKPRYEGSNISLGINLAMGWDRFFVALPVTYAWTDVDIIDNTVTALNITPRIGMTGDMGDRGSVAVFMGATYLRTEVDIAGTIDLDTPGGPDGDVTTLAYRISQRNKDRWNYLLGFNWDLNKRWSVMAEAGFGGSRENFIGGVTYRF
jgi:cysteine rich repeat protein